MYKYYYDNFYIGMEYNINNVSNANILVQSFNKAKKGVTWKGSVQKYQINLLTNISKLKHNLESESYKASHFVEFALSERGKTRWIKSMHINDRIVQRAVCDEVLLPLTKKYYIYDNGASLKDKGYDFALNRIEKHLKHYYNTYKDNEGYIILIDFSKYFDNLPHKILVPMFTDKIQDIKLKNLINYLFSLFEIEIGFLPKEKQEEYTNNIFNSLEYTQLKHNFFHNKNFISNKIKKSVGIGSQISQIAGIYYPTPIDNYFKIKCRVKYYERYMDDVIMIVRTKEEAIKLLNDFYNLATQYHIYINQKKTQIIKLKKGFTFLKIKYFLTPSGKIIKKISKDTIIRNRKKLKKLKNKLDNNKITYKDIYNSYQSHVGRLKQFNNYYALKNFQKLHNQLFI